MLDFRPMTPADVSRVRPLLDRTPDLSCEYSPACLLMWGRAQLADYEGCIIPMVNYGDGPRYLRPLGGDLLALLPVLEQDSRERGIPFRLSGLTPTSRALVEETGRYTVSANRDYFDYVYSIESLTTLAGRKLQAKRNHINRFIDQHPDWKTEPITRKNLPECQAMTERWYQEHYDRGFPPAFYKAEQFALGIAFPHYEEIGFDGLLLRAEGEVIGWSMGVPLSADTFDVCFEKAFSSMQGAYPLINREFSRMIAEKYPAIRWLDREDDMGEEGLRQAKLSYNPAVILEKSVAVLKEEFR